MNNETIISKYIKSPPDLMLDVGVGPKSEYLSLSKIYPEMKIIGLEPHPIRFSKILSCFNGVLLPYAAWDKKDRIDMYSLGDNAEFGDAPSCFKFSERKSFVTVEARPLDWMLDYFADFSNILLWMDIEGAEIKALNGAENLLKKVQYINIEVCETPLYNGACTKLEVNSFLTNFGFKLVHEYQFSIAHKKTKFNDAIYIR